MGRRIRVLAAADGAAPTGMARVAEAILSRLPDERFDRHQLAVNYGGDPHPLPWKLYRAGSWGDVHGVRRIRRLAEQLRPDAIFLYGDLWIIGAYLEALFEADGSSTALGRIVVYAPIEGSPVDGDWIRRLGRVDRVVLPTKWGRRELCVAVERGEARARLGLAGLESWALEGACLRQRPSSIVLNVECQSEPDEEAPRRDARGFRPLRTRQAFGCAPLPARRPQG